MQPYPRSPDLVWPGHLHGTGCLSDRAVGTGFPTVLRRLSLGPVGGWVWVLLTPPVLAGVLGGCFWARFVVLSLCWLFFFFFFFLLLPATPGWVSLLLVVGGPRHSWLGSAGGGGVWCVVCGVWWWCVGGVVAGVWCGWSLATPGGGSSVLLPATPGWVSLPVVVGGPRHSWLGSAGGGGV